MRTVQKPVAEICIRGSMGLVILETLGKEPRNIPATS